MSWLDVDSNLRCWYAASWWARFCFRVANFWIRRAPGCRHLMIRAALWSASVEPRALYEGCTADRARKKYRR